MNSLDSTIDEHDFEINFNTINKIMKSWPKRTTIRGCYFDELKKQNGYDPAIQDYPVEMVPFWNHPDFQKLDDELKYKILTWGWINYNRRTIHAEEKVANPAFALIMEGVFPGCEAFEIKSVVQQSLIDEHWHSFMHYNAIEATLQLRELEDNIRFPHSITYRKLVEAQAEVSENWKKKSMVLIWAIVSEISINAFLELLSKNEKIQPIHSLIAKYHDIDEFAHASILVELSKGIYTNMNKEQREFFVKYLPKAMHAFCAHDYSTWEVLLDHYNVGKAKEIIGDVKRANSGKHLVRDFSGLRKVAEALDIKHRMDFNFN
jgi:P-aminobenzoate N-oxygenase AurF.